MYHLTYHSLLHNILLLLIAKRDRFGTVIDFGDLVPNGVEVAEWEDYKMTTLGILAGYTVQQVVVLVVDLELLEFLCQATAVQDGSLANPPYILALEQHLDFRPITPTKTEIQIPEPQVRRIMEPIPPSNFPRPMRRRNEYPLHQPHLLLKSKHKIAHKTILLVRLVKFVLVGKIAWHEG